MSPIDFYFDFSSPYGYFAATRITALAREYGGSVRWRPMLLGAVFKVTGSGPLPTLPLKGPYSVKDMTRTARFLGVPFTLPEPFPIATQAPGRIAYGIESTRPDRLEEAVLTLYRAYFVEGLNISVPTVAAEAVSAIGIGREEALAMVDDPGLKDRLRQETKAAIERGVFGSPTVFIGDEQFWGVDRFDQVERWLREGGF